MLTAEQMSALHEHHDWLRATARKAITSLRLVNRDLRDKQWHNHMTYYKHMLQVATWSKMFIGNKLKGELNGRWTCVQLTGADIGERGRPDVGSVDIDGSRG